MSLSILALAGVDEISEAAAGVGAFPDPREFPPYSAPGFARPGTYLQPPWNGQGASAQRTMRGAFRGYHSGPPILMPYSGFGIDDLGPTVGSDKSGRYLLAGLGAVAIIAGVLYFTRDGGSDKGGANWDSAFTPNRRRGKRRKSGRKGRRAGRASSRRGRRGRDRKVGHFLSQMPTLRDLGGMSDGDADFLRDYWKRKGGKKFTSQYKRSRGSRGGRALWDSGTGSGARCLPGGS